MLFHKVWNIQSPPPNLWKFPEGLSSHSLLWLWAHFSAESKRWLDHSCWLLSTISTWMWDSSLHRLLPTLQLQRAFLGQERQKTLLKVEERRSYITSMSVISNLLLKSPIFISLLATTMRLLAKPGHSALRFLPAQDSYLQVRLHLFKWF